MKNYAIILASGTGKRFESDLPKQFAKINGKSLLEYSIEAFESCRCIDEIIVVITPEYNGLARKIIENNGYQKVIKLVNGGKERKDSSYIGVNSIDEIDANVLIHDCARPFVSHEIINNCIVMLEKYDAVAAAIPSTDTVIETKNGMITCVPDRLSLMRIQTPQCFRLSLIKNAHELSKNDYNFTDDCGLVIKHKLADIHIVYGSEQNIKITYPRDIKMAEFLINNMYE